MSAKTRQARPAKASQAFAENAPRFVSLLRESASATGVLKRLRPELEHLAKLMWSKPVSVADAAAGLSIDLSVKGLPADSPQRGETQRVRVTLARALKDAELLWQDPTKGRKPDAATTNTSTGAAPENATEVIKMTQAEVILKALPFVKAPKELRAIIKAAQAQLTAVRHVQPVANAAPLAAAI